MGKQVGGALFLFYCSGLLKGVASRALCSLLLDCDTALIDIPCLSGQSFLLVKLGDSIWLPYFIAGYHVATTLCNAQRHHAGIDTTPDRYNHGLHPNRQRHTNTFRTSGWSRHARHNDRWTRHDTACHFPSRPVHSHPLLVAETESWTQTASHVEYATACPRQRSEVLQKLDCKSKRE
jgi:hypothetical protein